MLKLSEVKELVHFIRSPTWIVPPQQDTLAGGSGKAAEILENVEMDGAKFTPQQIEKFKASPAYYLEFVKAVEEEVNSKFPLVSLLPHLRCHLTKSRTAHQRQ
jgi:hypothetical protein